MISYSRIRQCLVALVLFAPKVHANVDSVTCQELLEAVPAITMEYQGVLETGEIALRQGLNHEMSPIEFHATKDMMAGLAMKLIADNGRTFFVPSAPNPHRVKEMNQFLNRFSLEEIQYPPETLMKIGKVLKQVCLAVERTGCEVYDVFAGFTDPTARPFTVLQEQGLKWAILYALPPPTLPWMHAQASKALGHKASLSILNDARDLSLTHALHIIPEVFEDPEDLTVILDDVVGPMISSAWRAAIAKLEGKHPH